MNSTRDNLLDGATQLLRHYQRCGIVAVPRPNEAWAAAWSSAPTPKTAGSSGNIASASNRLTDALVAAPTVAVASDPLKAPIVPPSSAVPYVPSKPGSSHLLQIAEGDWTRPSLPVEERGEVFRSLGDEVRGCVKCKDLACSRKQTVFGVGSLQPRVVLFGEAPGAEEDRLGEPFVGPAGQLLNKIITAAKMKRDEVYILNSLKCRPPNNRTPVDEEIANCRPFFETQLDVLQPEYIVCLGAVAARAVLQTTESVGRLRGRFHRYRSARVLVTYHPSYLLRNEGAKRFVWDDMQMLMRAMGLLPS